MHFDGAETPQYPPLNCTIQCPKRAALPHAMPESAHPSPTPAAPVVDTVVFDLGKVLLDWDPRYFYARHFHGDTAALEHFVTHIIPSAWIVEMDAGKPAAQAIAERQRAHPQHADLIGRWTEGWPLMLRGEIPGTATLLRELKARGLHLYALTNFSTETFPIARERCPSLALFEDIVVSGEIGLIKPDPRIYAHTNTHCRLNPPATAFIDDMPANVAAGRAAGWHALHFTSPEQLRADLATLGLLQA